jgi:hypothetical protein
MTQPGYQVLEHSCHEGNFFVANALKAEQRLGDPSARYFALGHRQQLADASLGPRRAVRRFQFALRPRLSLFAALS